MQVHKSKSLWKRENIGRQLVFARVRLKKKMRRREKVGENIACRCEPAQGEKRRTKADWRKNAKALGIVQSTYYRKMGDGGGGFALSQAIAVSEVLS